MRELITRDVTCTLMTQNCAVNTAAATGASVNYQCLRHGGNASAFTIARDFVRDTNNTGESDYGTFPRKNGRRVRCRVSSIYGECIGESERGVPIGARERGGNEGDHEIIVDKTGYIGKVRLG